MSTLHSVCVRLSFPYPLDRTWTPEHDQNGDFPGESGNEGFIIINMDTLMHMSIM